MPGPSVGFPPTGGHCRRYGVDTRGFVQFLEAKYTSGIASQIPHVIGSSLSVSVYFGAELRIAIADRVLIHWLIESAFLKLHEIFLL
jgi:hypothetical protein